MSDLAVVIPAYKIRYFDQALSSLAAQTSKQFKVYVGDDASHDDISGVCEKYKERMDISYHRFETNLGGQDLVKHWERCVALISHPKWLWLFSDDDIAEEKCVESFYNAINNTNGSYDVYRFNTRVIDQDGNFKSEAEPSPRVENPMSLAYNILLWKRGNSMPDHIFRYSSYQELGGFVNFPFAQATDWATSIHFSYPGGLYTIPGPKVNWRLSGDNVSSSTSANKHKMILAHLEFIEWVNSRFTKEDERVYGITSQQINDASLVNLKAVLLLHYKGIPSSVFITLVRRMMRLYKHGLIKALELGLSVNYRVMRPRFSLAVRNLLSLKRF